MEVRRRRIHYTSGFAFRHVSKTSYYLIAILSYDHINIAAAEAVCRELAYMDRSLESNRSIESNRIDPSIESTRIDSNQIDGSIRNRLDRSNRFESSRSIESIRSIESNRLESIDGFEMVSIDRIDFESSRNDIELLNTDYIIWILSWRSYFMTLPIIMHPIWYAHDTLDAPAIRYHFDCLLPRDIADDTN